MCCSHQEILFFENQNMEWKTLEQICRVSVYLLLDFSQKVFSFLIHNHHTYHDYANKSGQISNPDNLRDCVEHSSKIIEICFCQLKLKLYFYVVTYFLQVFSDNIHSIWWVSVPKICNQMLWYHSMNNQHNMINFTAKIWYVSGHILSSIFEILTVINKNNQ